MVFDVAVLGAGVIGSLVTRELSKYKLNICLIDRFPEPGFGASKANSAIVHAGYDAKEGTLKAAFNVKGSLMMGDLCKELAVPYKKTGSLVLAFNDKDEEKIAALYERGKKNGVDIIEIIGRGRVLALEPHINPDVKSALYAKNAGIVNPYLLTCFAAENAVDNGVVPYFDTKITEFEKKKDIFEIQSEKGVIKAHYLINCAGAYADCFAGEKDFKIIPRKGEYMLLDKKFGEKVSHILFNTPTEKGKGILVAPTTHGNIVLGPTSFETSDREDTETTKEGREQIISSVKRIIPGLDINAVITSFAGVRAASSAGDFLVGASSAIKGLINAAGIDSPGLTAAPAIAEYICGLLKKQGLALTPKEKHKKSRVMINPNEMDMDERNKLIKENPAYGRIVCRCESISEGEIVDAIKRNAGARTVDGVKWRVRAGMGRCQGGFCLPRVLEILSRELNIPEDEITKKGGESKILGFDMKKEKMHYGN